MPIYLSPPGNCQFTSSSGDFGTGTTCVANLPPGAACFVPVHLPICSAVNAVLPALNSQLRDAAHQPVRTVCVQ